MVGSGDGPRVLSMVSARLALVTIAVVLGLQWATRERSGEDIVERTPWAVRAIALGAMIEAIILMQGPDRAFLYFQF